MNKILKIEIFGKGCKNCDLLEKNVLTAAEELNKNVKVHKITDLDEIVERGVFKTPGLAINGTVISTGRVLSPNKIKEQLEMMH